MVADSHPASPPDARTTKSAAAERPRRRRRRLPDSPDPELSGDRGPGRPGGPGGAGRRRQSPPALRTEELRMGGAAAVRCDYVRVHALHSALDAAIEETLADEPLPAAPLVRLAELLVAEQTRRCRAGTSARPFAAQPVASPGGAAENDAAVADAAAAGAAERRALQRLRAAVRVALSVGAEPPPETPPRPGSPPPRPRPPRRLVKVRRVRKAAVRRGRTGAPQRDLLVSALRRAAASSASPERAAAAEGEEAGAGGGGDARAGGEGREAAEGDGEQLRRRAEAAEASLALQLRVDEELRKQLAELQQRRVDELKRAAAASRAAPVTPPPAPLASPAGWAEVPALEVNDAGTPVHAESVEVDEGAAPRASPGRGVLLLTTLLGVAVPASGALMLAGLLTAGSSSAAALAAQVAVLVLYPAAALLLLLASPSRDTEGLPPAWLRLLPLPVYDVLLLLGVRRGVVAAGRVCQVLGGVGMVTQALPQLCLAVLILKERTGLYGALDGGADSPGDDGDDEPVITPLACSVAAAVSFAAVLLHGAVAPMCVGEEESAAALVTPQREPAAASEAWAGGDRQRHV